MPETMGLLTTHKVCLCGQLWSFLYRLSREVKGEGVGWGVGVDGM